MANLDISVAILTFECSSRAGHTTNVISWEYNSLKFSSLKLVKMIRMGGPEIDSEEERRMSNAAVIGNVVIFAFTVFSVNVAPYLLEQLGFDVVK